MQSTIADVMIVKMSRTTLLPELTNSSTPKIVRIGMQTRKGMMLRDLKFLGIRSERLPMLTGLVPPFLRQEAK
jgi:hypothetical protein